MQVLSGSSVVEEVEIDRKPFYIFGTTLDSDFRPDHSPQATGGRHFAALVHHSDSRLFLIDLQTVSPTKPGNTERDDRPSEHNLIQ